MPRWIILDSVAMILCRKRRSNPGHARSVQALPCTRRITAYPVRLTGPGKLAGKETQVQRVALYECQTCGHLMPTPAGLAKVAR